MSLNRIDHPDQQAGFLLIEVMVAILIFSIGILAVVGLQATMIKNSTDARYRAIASQVAEQRIALMWANPAQAAAGIFLEQEPGTDISQILPGGRRVVSQPVANQFLVTVRWQQPGQDLHTFSTIAYVVGGI